MLNKYKKIYFYLSSDSDSFYLFTVSYGEEQKKPDATTQQPQKIEQTQKDKENALNGQRKGEPGPSITKEIPKKKVPAFWFFTT
jgi:hypothetical protein